MRKKVLKKYLPSLLVLAIVIGVFSVPLPISAATKKCYTISSGNTTVYSNSGLTKRYGSIYGSDEVTVLAVNSFCSRVRYPISRGRTKTGYIHTSAILTATSGTSYKAGARITTYRRPGGASYGYISKNDTVTVLGKSGNYTQVKYPVNGGYKYAFVPTTSVQRYITGQNQSTPTIPSSSGQADAQMEQAIQWAMDIANDNSHGYSQDNRWGPDYDCSSFVITALKNAGFRTGSATYTANMRSNLTTNGFTWIPWYQIGSMSNLKRGDILLNEIEHTEIYLGNGQILGAHSHKGHPETGDQTGGEISVCGYYNHPWDGVLRYGGSVNISHDPQGVLDSAEGSWNKIRVYGWAFDADDYNKQLDIHVYLENSSGSQSFVGAIKANKSRPDVGRAYPGAGNYHGYDEWVTVNASGRQTVHVYAINVGGGINVELGAKTVNLSDTEKPVIKNVKISDVTAHGYTVSCTVTDNVAVERVQFPTWTEKNGQDDIQRNWDVNPAASGRKSGNTYTYYVAVSDHNYEAGKYITHIYAYDKSGNWSACAAPAVTIKEQTVYYGDLDMNGEITVTDLSGVMQAANGTITLNDELKKRADVNGDGKIDSLDVNLISQYISKVIDKFPVEG